MSLYSIIYFVGNEVFCFDILDNIAEFVGLDDFVVLLSCILGVGDFVEVTLGVVVVLNGFA